MSGTGGVRVYSKMARAIYAGIWTIGLLATVGGVVDPTAGLDEVQLLPGGAFVAAEALVLVRSFRLGLVIGDQRVTSRGILRTRTFPRASITKVKPIAYSGTINWGGEGRYFMMLELRVDGKAVELPHLIGPPNAAHRLASEARTALRLIESPRTPLEPKNDPQNRQ